ncbi:RecA-superfamily ATPase [Halalkaliarchaeum desulfuricum]|uniref:RecA-superfamily ATPase n=1 Tax=Halalkaliarchaeum desulfuricum TaxID=2055893 RepID=A0A343TJU8_9EURY|nr:RecA-superfamily ATPase [Halalkaliarchaeum desulfuricum]
MPAGRLCVVTGAPGSGKTTFCAQFVTEGVANGETCLYISMHETREGITEDMSGFSFGFSFGFERAIETERLKFLDAFSSHGSRFFGNPGANGRLRALEIGTETGPRRASRCRSSSVARAVRGGGTGRHGETNWKSARLPRQTGWRGVRR